ncbi:hypothetical protein SAMN05216188_106293 [Lentzea xinjiangensis]|uniref:Uncharacterized protein n=1 Tax=Lentzea xinjiangensis TaxID=402600 RepID=A0A1H9K570_9PSEU|nr:hypothetical protein [Lentzea xinjiangensis]SEQ94053.1 hypothetical protein SAMN05216188_106293 [Lentzea xinjiangensis]
MMPTTPQAKAKGAATCFAEARIAAGKAEAVQQRHAARRVAEHSRDADDCRDLLLMLGLSDLAPSGEPRLPHDLSADPASPEALGVFRSTEGALR